MARLRRNFQSGFVSGPLTATGTTATLYSPELANLPAVTTGDQIVLVLDPNGEYGPPEIVWLTAHTTNATSGTISRAQEGTSARAHPLNTRWINALSAQDLDLFITSGSGNQTLTGSFLVIAGSTTSVAQIVRAVASQTVNLQEWRNSSNSAIASMGASGYFRTSDRTVIGSMTVDPAGTLNVVQRGTTEKGIIIRQAASSTVNLVELQNNANTANLFTIGNTGAVVSASSVTGTIGVFRGGESSFASGTYADPDAGVTRAIKVGAGGVAVLGGIRTDTLTVTGSSTISGPTTINDGATVNGAFTGILTAATEINSFQAAASQTANLLEFRNSTGGIMSRVSATGQIFEGANRVYSAATPNLASTIAGTLTFGSTGAVGTGTAYARNDHTHPMPATPVTSAVAGTGISVSAATGAVTIGNTGVLSAIAGTNMTVSGATGNVTLSVVGTPTFAGDVTAANYQTSGTAGTYNALGTGMSTIQGVNEFIFTRAGVSYIRQRGVGGTLQFTTSNVAVDDVTALTFAANGGATFGATLAVTGTSTFTGLTTHTGGVTTPGDLTISGTGGQLNLSASGGTVTGTGTGIGDKINLYAGTYGFGVQSLSRLVAFAPSTGAFVVRPTAGTGNKSSGTDAHTFFTNGDATHTGNLSVTGTSTFTGRTTHNQGSALTAAAATVVLDVLGAATPTADLAHFRSAAGVTTRFSSQAGLFINMGGITNVPFAVNSMAAGNTVSIFRAAASQTANLMEWQNSTPAIVARVGPTGDILTNDRLYVGTLTSGFFDGGTAGAPTAGISSRVAGNTALVVRGVASQTADLVQVQNSAGTILTRMNSGGALQVPAVGIGTGITAYPLAISTGSNEVVNFVGGGRTFRIDTNGVTYSGTSTLGRNTTGGLGMLEIYSTAAATKGIYIQGAAGQTGDLIDMRNSDGVQVARIDSNGVATFSGSVTSNGSIEAVSPTAVTVTFSARGAAGQSANLTEWRDSAGTVLSYVTANGTIFDKGAQVYTTANLPSDLARVGAANTFTQPQTIDSSGGTVELTVRGSAGQTVNLTNWTTSANAVVASVGVNGDITANNLLVARGTAASPTLRFGGTSNSGIYSPAADQVAISTAGTAGFIIDGANKATFTGEIHSAPGIHAPVRPAVSTPNSGSTAGGQWTKIATATITLRYGDSQAHLHILQAGDGNAIESWADLIFRVKQQAAFLEDPIIDLTYIEGRLLQPTDFVAIIASNAGPTVVELWMRAPTTFQTFFIFPRTGVGSANVSMAYHNNFAYQAALPAGTQRVATPGLGIFGAGNSPTGVMLTTRANAITAIPLRVGQFAGQTGDLTQWVNSADAVINRITADGSIANSNSSTYLLSPSATMQNFITANSAAGIPLALRGAASQTADLQQWQNSTGTTLSQVNASGHIFDNGSRVFSANNLPTWAQVTTKPSWLGAVNLTDVAPADINSLGNRVSGFFDRENATNAPLTGWFSYINVRHPNVSNNNGFQLAAPHAANRMFFRTYTGGTGADTGIANRTWLEVAALNEPQTYTATKTFVSSAATAIPVIVQGAASQTGDLQNWRDSGNTTLAKITSAGDIVASGFASVTGRLSVGPNASTIAPQVSIFNSTAGQHAVAIRAAASQTGDLTQWQNSSGTLISYVNSIGAHYAPDYHRVGVTGTAIHGGTNRDNMLAQPYGREVWNDKIRFTQPTVEVAAQATGQTWTAATSANFWSLFDARTDTGVELLNPTQQSVRFTFPDLGGFNNVTHLLLGYQYSVTPVSPNILWESSPDGVTWTTRYSGTINNGSANWHAIPLTDPSDGGRFRLTLSATVPTGGTLRVFTIQAFSGRPGDQGAGKQNEMPYSWNHFKTVTMQSNTSTAVSLVARLPSAGTADIQQWQNASSVVLTSIASNGALVSTQQVANKLGGGSMDTSAILTLATSNAAAKGLTVRGAASQSTNLTEWQNSSNTVLASVSASGQIFSAGLTSTGSINIVTPGNASIEIGRTDGVASTPFIDFHSGATSVDYDSRIIASGGDGSNDGGTLTWTGASFLVSGRRAASTVLTVRAAPGQTSNILTFQNSAATEVASIGPAGRFTAPAGSATDPGFRFLGDTNTGIYRPTTDSIGITTAGVLAASWDAMGQQYVHNDIILANANSKIIKSLYPGSFTGTNKAFDHIVGYAALGAVTGAIQFTAPYGGLNLMQKLSIEGYTYDSNGPLGIELGLYDQLASGSKTIVNSGFSSEGSLKPTVRAGFSPAATTDMAAPTLTTATTGGTLAAGVYNYRVSVQINGGESRPVNSAAITTTGTTSTVTVAWTAVTNATGYRIWRSAAGGAAGTETLLATVAGTAVDYVDTGAVTPTGAMPTTNTTMANSKLMITLGDTNTVWQHPKFFITRAITTHSSHADTVMDGWTSSLVTSFSHIGNQVTVPNRDGIFQNITVTAATAAGVTAIFKGATSQTGDLTQWQNSGGTVLSRVGADGSLNVNIASIANNALAVQSLNATGVPAIIRGVASQSGDLTQWQDSGLTTVASISSAGNITTAGSLSVTRGSTFFDTMIIRPGSQNTTALIARSSAARDTIINGVLTTTQPTVDIQQWQNSGGTVLTSIAADGRLHVNVNNATSGTGTATPAVRVGTRAGIMSWVPASGPQATGITDNVYHDGTDWRQLATSTSRSGLVWQQDGTFTFYNFPASTAGATVTPTERFRVNETGNLVTSGTIISPSVQDLEHLSIMRTI